MGKMMSNWPEEWGGEEGKGKVCLGLIHFVSRYPYMLCYLSVCFFILSYLEKITIKLFFSSISN